MNIYVGNLPYSTSEDNLREAFEEYGTTDSVSIIKDKMTGKSRGFGFVEMSNDEEAQSAISELDGVEFDGRSLTVNEARPRKERSDR